MIISKEHIDSIFQHARNEYPKEVCEIVAGINNKSTKKIFCLKNSFWSNLNYVTLFCAENSWKIFKEDKENQHFELIGNTLIHILQVKFLLKTRYWNGIVTRK